MSTLQPLTVEEQKMAEQYFFLVDEFLRRKRLDPNDYYDVVIFGYLQAIQRECRQEYPEEDKNFHGLVEVCMRCAVYQEWRRLGCDKRMADRLSLSFDSIPAHTYEGEFSFYEVVADAGADTEEEAIGRDLLERMLAEATPREREAIDLARLGYETHEIAALMGVAVNVASHFLYNFRVKARAVMEDREVVRSPQWTRSKEKVQAWNMAYQQSQRSAHLEEARAKDRVYYEAQAEQKKSRSWRGEYQEQQMAAVL